MEALIRSLRSPRCVFLFLLPSQHTPTSTYREQAVTLLDTLDRSIAEAAEGLFLAKPCLRRDHHHIWQQEARKLTDGITADRNVER